MNAKDLISIQISLTPDTDMFGSSQKWRRNMATIDREIILSKSFCNKEYDAPCVSKLFTNAFSYLVPTHALYYHDLDIRFPPCFKPQLDPVPRVNSCPRGFCCCVKLDSSYQVSKIAEIFWVNQQGALEKQLDPGR